MGLMTKPADKILRTNDSSTATSPDIGNWRTPNTDRPVMVIIDMSIDPGSTSTDTVAIEIDESGGTTADYSYSFIAPAGTGQVSYTESFFIPAGGSWRLTNESTDTGGTNALFDAFEVDL